MRKGLYQLEVIKDNEAYGLKKGEIVESYGCHLIVDIEGMKHSKKEDDYMCFINFLIWLPDHGWISVEKCYFKPVGEKLNLPGIC